ncbi:MAG: phytanoyl-CoA dioxygenase family protein [Alphaproteobacteria bacterium]|nr:phytanoyl-CoA dioxygenase family protein [Alphaproteobacteria bacterium]
MQDRHTPEHVEAWRREGALVIPNFFTPQEVATVVADFRQVFGEPEAAQEALVRPPAQGPGTFHPSQFKTIESVPLDCSPALNLIGLHPALVAYARACLGTDDVHLYQCQAWAKYTGAADYNQPFHCDYVNHTLTAPSQDERLNSFTVICYFTDVTEAHGPTHYVVRPDSDPFAPPEATLAYAGEAYEERQRRLGELARTTAAPAGSIFPYGIDVYHRGTNLTAPRGHRYTVTACFKRARNDAIAFTAWAFHHLKPWARIFDHASPEQLACFGVPRPGDPFWTETTLARTQARYPKWNAAPYRAALAAQPVAAE